MWSRFLICIIVFCASINGVLAQTEDADSADIFSMHLKMNEVVVTGLTGDTKLKHSTNPVSVLQPVELRQTASTNIVDAVAKQPGLDQITTGSGISKPVIRGLGYNRIITMSEGVRQEGQQWGDEHGIEVDGQGVGSVEIIKGPASLMYGSDAMAGVMILHAPTRPEDGEAVADFSSEYQSNNGLFATSLRHAASKGGFVWDARYSFKTAHAYKNKYDGYVPGSQFSEQDARLLFGLKRRWGFSNLSFSLFHQTPSIVEGERDSISGNLISENDNLKTYHKTLPFQKINHYKLVWDNSISIGEGSLKAIVGFQQNQRKEFEDSNDEYELFFRLNTLTYDIKYILYDIAGWRLAAGVGGMFQTSANLGEEVLIPEYNLFDIGTCFTASKSFDMFTLSGGLRYDARHIHGKPLEEDDDMRFNDFKRNFNAVSGSVGSVWNITDCMNLRLNIARGFRAPNMSELGSNGEHEGTLRYEIGNSNLKPEHSMQVDLGFDFHSSLLTLQTALFANRIDNFIFAHRSEQEMEEGLMTYIYTQGDARLLGFEAGCDFHPLHWLHFQNAFSMVDARLLKQKKESRYLPFTPPARWSSELKFELTHGKKYLLDNAYAAIAMSCHFRQNHYYMTDNTETATPAYALWSISAGADIIFHKKKVAEIYLIADNITNKAYQSHLSRLKYADVNNATGRQGVYNMGRNIILKLFIPINWKI